MENAIKQLSPICHYPSHKMAIKQNALNMQLQDAESQPISPLKRSPGLENSVPQEKGNSHVAASKPTARDKQLEEALRHHARLQQELVLAQRTITKKEEQVSGREQATQWMGSGEVDTW
jgi:hypothetical protein